jgi:hypothetical protein
MSVAHIPVHAGSPAAHGAPAPGTNTEPVGYQTFCGFANSTAAPSGAEASPGNHTAPEHLDQRADWHICRLDRIQRNSESGIPRALPARDVVQVVECFPTASDASVAAPTSLLVSEQP